MWQARDTFFGGALLLTSRGIVYLSAPSYALHDLASCRDAGANHGGSTLAMEARRRVFLLPHAYYLYQKAQTILQSGPTNDDLADMADGKARLRSFSCDCLLHMLLNDLVRTVAFHEGHTASEGARSDHAEVARRLLTRLLGPLLGVNDAVQAPPPESGGFWSFLGRGRAPTAVTTTPKRPVCSDTLLGDWMVCVYMYAPPLLLLGFEHSSGLSGRAGREGAGGGGGL